MRPFRILANLKQTDPSGEGLVALLLLLAGLGSGLVGTTCGLLGATGWGLLASLAVGALLNAGVVLGGLAVRRRLLRREALRDQWQRELRYLAAWASEEGILRKVGLIRDLSELKARDLSLAQTLLPGADLRGCLLAGADFRGADLKGADLQGAVLDGADLSDANLSDANLAMVSLRRGNLRGCVLEGANLAKCDVEGAILVRANLVRANVHGVDFTRARLERTRFALREPSDFASEVHPSVEDWIRERLDGRGYYVDGTEAAKEQKSGFADGPEALSGRAVR